MDKFNFDTLPPDQGANQGPRATDDVSQNPALEAVTSLSQAVVEDLPKAESKGEKLTDAQLVEIIGCSPHAWG